MENAGITLKELLEIPVLKEAIVVSGKHGLDRVVRYIDILEVPELKGWARQGELLLTTGYPVKDNPEQLEGLIKELVHVEAAALIIKFERYLDEIPENVLFLSEKFNFPIIRVPSEIPYIDITHAVMEQILHKQAALLRKADEVYRRLSKLVLNESGLQVVANNVAGVIDSAIWVVNQKGETVVSSPAGLDSPSDYPVQRWELKVDKRLLGHLLIEKENLDELELICIEQARMVFSLEFMREKIREDNEARLRGDFLQKLLLGVPISKEEMTEKSRQFQFQRDWAYQTIVFKGNQVVFDEESPFQNALKSFVAKFFKKRKGKAYIQNQGDLLVLIAAADSHKEWMTGLLNELERWLEKWEAYQAGIGSLQMLDNLSRSYQHAKQSLEFGSKINETMQTHMYLHYEFFQLLLQAYNHEWESLIDKRIGKLRAHDKEKGTDFVITLYHYLDTNGSLMETAKRLYIHRNSVKYRMDKIKEMVDIPFETELEKAIYYIAIAIFLLKK